MSLMARGSGVLAKRTAPAEEIVATTTIEKDHGRIETRCHRASANVD